jgi:hypothetical protein
MKNYINILFVLLLLSCNNNNNKSAITDKEKDSTQQVDTNHVTYKTPTDSLLARINNKEYISMGDPDTALALFLYNNYLKFNFEDQAEEYIRWDLENKKIKPLIANLFLKDKTNDSLLPILERNRNLFVRQMRDKVIADYNQFDGVSGMYFDFLVKRNDSLVKPLLKRLLSNSKAPADEKEYATSVLKELNAKSR